MRGVRASGMSWGRPWLHQKMKLRAMAAAKATRAVASVARTFELERMKNLRKGNVAVPEAGGGGSWPTCSRLGIQAP